MILAPTNSAVNSQRGEIGDLFCSQTFRIPNGPVRPPATAPGQLFLNTANGRLYVAIDSNSWAEIVLD